MNKVECLIISSSIDYSTDYICLELMDKGISYLRLNRDQFQFYDISLSIDPLIMTVKTDDNTYVIEDETLRSVYFRAPVFYRSFKSYSVEEQLSRSQWSSFIRNLTVFSNAVWINHPDYTYQAENKAYQLLMAREVGLQIPSTVIANKRPAEIKSGGKYVVKALDTPLFYDKNVEMFTYSSIVDGSEITDDALQDAPVFIQECLEDKVDIRVTYIGQKMYPVKILIHGQGIDGDWRKNEKENLEYIPMEIPDEISGKLIILMNKLHLNFGGIDLIYCKGRYYFIEVNPTGEWGWLINTAHLKIDKAIVGFMTNG